MKGSNKGFTLIELLIVIGILGFLAAAILVAVDPVKRIQDSRDASRSSETNGILEAILKKQVDDVALYNGESSAPVITDATNAQIIVSDDTGIICNNNSNHGGCNQQLDLSAADKDCVANLSGLIPNYLAELPVDPRGAGSTLCPVGSGCTEEGDLVLGTTNSGYYIHRTAGNRIEIGACGPEQATDISVKR